MLVLTDAELVESTQSGDEKAFETLVEKHRARIDSTISAFIDNTQDREDIAQETFITAHRNMHQLSNPNRFSYWLVTIARNQCRDWIRRNQSHTIPIDEVDENLLNSDNSPERESIEAEQQQIIAQAIETLLETERQIASAYYLKGESHRELISRHGISYQAVCTRLSRAKQKLAKRLGHLLTGVFVSPMPTLKQIYSGGLTVMKVGTVPKITAGVVAIIVLVFIGTRHFISSKEESSPSVEVVTSTPTESANSVTQRDAAPRKDVVPPSSREDKPQLSADEMEQIEDFFAQLDEADSQSGADKSHLPTDGASGQDSDTDNTGPFVASEDTGLSAEDVMNTYVEAFKNVDFEKMRLLMTGSAKERSRLHEDVLRNNHYIDFTEVRTEGRVVTEEMDEVIEEKNMELKQQLEHQIFESLLKMYSQVEVVNSEYIGGEFHFQLRMPVSPIHQGESEAIMGNRESQEEIQAVLRAVFPEDIEQSVKMRNENGAWLIYENGS